MDIITRDENALDSPQSSGRGSHLTDEAVGLDLTDALNSLIFETEKNTVRDPTAATSLAGKFAYDYVPFEGPGEFRLVRILPGEEDEPIKCEIRHTTFIPNTEGPASSKQIGRAPTYIDYSALSYEWEWPSAEDPEIFINETRHTVRKNLFTAMLQLRCALMKSKTSNLANSTTNSSNRKLWPYYSEAQDDPPLHWLWIDAICIDQLNLGERNRQVRLMRDIYGSAKKVIIWLGTARNDSDIAFSTLQNSLSSSGSNISQTQARALLALVSRPYWNRIWIVQEIMCAKDLILLCGDKSLSWEDMHATRASREPGQHTDPSFSTPILRTGRHQIHTIMDVLHLSMAVELDILRTNEQLRQAEGTELRHWLSVCRRCESTNPRDKVYALLGLATDDELEQKIEIDYAKSVAQIYLDVVNLYAKPSREKPYVIDKIGLCALCENLQKMLGIDLEEDKTLQTLLSSSTSGPIYLCAEVFGAVTSFHTKDLRNRYESLRKKAAPRDLTRLFPIKWNDENFNPVLKPSEHRNDFVFDELDLQEVKTFETDGDYQTGIGPPSTKLGDVLIRFPGSKIGLLMRDQKWIVGRARCGNKFVTNEFYMSSWKGKKRWDYSSDEKKIYIKVDMEMLYLLAAR